jgi:hypothetical protein
MKSTMAVFLFIIFASLSAQTKTFALRSELSKNLQPVYQAPELNTTAKKSGFTAVMYSLLLPGMGELYADGFDQGRYSLIAEGGLWLTYISYHQYGTWLRTDARNFAASNAGVNVAGKNDQFFIDVGNFDNTYDYNEKKLRDRDPLKVYDVNSSYFWSWSDDSKRQEFRSLRVSSERVLTNSGFVIGAIIVNHIISAVNAARLTRQYNKQLDEGLGDWWIESSILSEGTKPDGIKLSFVKSL